MKIAVSGITGFIGSTFKQVAEKRGHVIVPLSRKSFALGSKELALALEGCDAVINLAGAPVIKRWTDSHKKAILNSRVETTSALVDAFSVMTKKPSVFVNASAIGIYDYEHENDEFSDFLGNNFLAGVVKKWEEEATRATRLKIRTCIARFGVVMGRDGGAFPVMLRPFKMGFGGKIASGEQAISFIHIDDLIRALFFLLENPKSKGIYNFVAPNYCTNSHFTMVLANSLNKPAIFTVPPFVLRMLYGQAADVVIGGEKVVPRRLLNEGFKFRFPSIKLVIDDLLSKKFQ